MPVAFAPAVAPCFPLEDQREPKVNKVEFGDGYSQRSRDGINHDLEKVTVKWEGLSAAEFQPIWDFFEDRGGDEAFSYAIPWLPGDPEKTYVCPRYSRLKKDANNFDITCEWEEVVGA